MADPAAGSTAASPAAAGEAGPEALARLLEAARREPKLLSCLTAANLERLRALAAPDGDAAAASGAAGSPEVDKAIGRLLLRREVWSVRQRAARLFAYSAEETEAALSSYELPAALAARCGLPEQDGQTWLDAVAELRRAAEGETAVKLWQRIERHPIVEYVPVQCQACGRQVPDRHPAPPEPNLRLEEPTEEERPYVRAGWFRGPQDAVIFVYTCPDCQATSRWFRSARPEHALNPRRWGRLCGEQEDLKLWLAHYLGVRLRMCRPMDWDHVWTEVYNDEVGTWRPLDPNCVNFARRLHEGIGSWTRVLAIGTPASGGASSADTTEDATETYLELAGGRAEEVAAWHAQISAARADASGASTQSRTLVGHVLEVAGIDGAAATAELRQAQRDFDAGGAWCELPPRV